MRAQEVPTSGSRGFVSSAACSCVTAVRRRCSSSRPAASRCSNCRARQHRTGRRRQDRGAVPPCARARALPPTRPCRRRTRRAAAPRRAARAHAARTRAGTPTTSCTHYDGEADEKRAGHDRTGRTPAPARSCSWWRPACPAGPPIRASRSSRQNETTPPICAAHPQARIAERRQQTTHPSGRICAVKWPT
jgi:hypothetical protein